MDQHQYISAFIKSTQSIFETMLQMPVAIGEPSILADGPSPFEVSAVISLTGDVHGSVVLSFQRPTAERLISIFTGMDMSESDEDLSDAVGELVNIIAGGAKAQFNGQKVGLGLPSVVIGNGHAVFGQRGLVCVAIPCDCDCGTFQVQIALKSTAAPSDTTNTPEASNARGAS